MICPGTGAKQAAARGAQSPNERGSALIAVLWLAAAVSVIALALAAQVRNEIERASSYSDSIRAYYMATGSIQRAFLWMQWGPTYRFPDGSPRYYLPPSPRMTFSYPDGMAVVEVIPESSKLNVNGAKPEELFRLMIALGANEAHARLLAEAIVDWRSAAGSSDGTGPFDAVYRASSFLAPHASFKQLEELLLVRGMTTDLFYGHFGPTVTGEMVYYPALRDCLTTYSNGMAMFDINSVPGPVLEAVGWPVAAVRPLELIRSRRAFQTMSEVAQVVPPELLSRVGIGGGNVITLRATAALRTPDGRLAGLKRTVSAVVKTGGGSGAVSADPSQWVMLRWYDNEASAVLPQAPWIGGPAAPTVASSGSAENVATPEAGEKEEPVKVYRPEVPGASNGSSGAAGTNNAPSAGEEKDQPVRIYRSGGSTTANGASTSGTSGTKDTREVLKVYRPSGSGSGEASPKQP